MARFVARQFDDVVASGAWRTTITIHFGDCDPSGIVYTPQYFNLFNGAIEDWYGAALGISYRALITDRKLGVGYAHVSADFAKPSFIGDILDVAIVVTALGRSSLTLTVHAFKDGIERVRATFVTVTTSLERFEAIPIPDDLRTAFAAYQQRCERPTIS
jgi:acyl-CoA thioesterase FadM